mmetsp:Transcript_9952/g.38688  ORF Transcript_9952/g.38688 Transcript_9952/m.38688 type:complete len:352 (-) Transcript_9952:300-1355(-)
MLAALADADHQLLRLVLALCTGVVRRCPFGISRGSGSGSGSSLRVRLSLGNGLLRPASGLGATALGRGRIFASARVGSCGGRRRCCAGGGPLSRCFPARPDVQGVPGASALDESAAKAEVNKLADAGDTSSVGHVELRHAEGRRELVLDHADAGGAGHNLVALLDLAGAADVQSDGCVVLEGLPSRSHLGGAEDHAHLGADLVDEDDERVGAAHRGRQLAQSLGHEAGLQRHVVVAHVPLQLGARDQGSDGVEDDHVHSAGAHEGVHDLEGVLARVRLGEQEVVDVHAELERVRGVDGVLHVDEDAGHAPLLRLGHGLQGKGGLAAGLGAVNLDHAAARESSDAERDVERQ